MLIIPATIVACRILSVNMQLYTFFNYIIMCLCAGNLELKYLFGLVRTVVNFEMLDAALFHLYCAARESKKWDYPYALYPTTIHSSRICFERKTSERLLRRTSLHF